MRQLQGGIKRKGPQLNLGAWAQQLWIEILKLLELTVENWKVKIVMIC